MRTERLNRLRFLCLSILTLFVIALAFAWGGRFLTNSEMMRIFGTGGLPPVSIPEIDGVTCGESVIHYAPVGTSLRFDSIDSYDPDGWITEYYWSFGDGGVRSLTMPNTIYPAYSGAGHYYPTLRVTDDAPSQSTTQHGYVTAFEGEILATSDSQFNPYSSSTATIHYQVLPTTSFTPTSVTLTIKQGLAEIKSISLPTTTGQQQTTWDGRDSSGALVSVGSYDAILEVVVGGKTDTSYHQISVVGPPVADAGVNQVVDLTATVSFDGSDSYDSDSGNIVTYSWDFGVGASPATGSGVTASCTYSTVGEKTVTLTVTDNDGHQASATCTITVTLPVADAGGDQIVDLTATVSFDGSGSYDPDGGNIVTYSWAFGADASPAPGSGVTTSCTYSTVGEKTVTLTVTDDEGSQASATCTITVTLPVADPGDDKVVAKGIVVHFDGSGSHDPDDGTGPWQGITDWEWSFPGGTPASATTQTASTTYNTAGEKTVILTVTDNEQHQVSATCTVSVSPPLPPVARAGDDRAVAINTTVNFDGSGSYDPDDGDDPGQGITNWEWSFPGGTPASATGSSASTTYNTPGIKTASLTVTDNDTPALVATATLTVNVVSIEPQTVNDGARAGFTVLGDTGAVAWSWDWRAPDEAGNSPNVTFSPPNMRTTWVPNAKWFALPNRACKISEQEPAASTSCVYTITCEIVFPTTTSFTATSSLTVNVPWTNPAGQVRPGFGGTLKTKYNNATQLWEVTGLGSLERVIDKTVFIPLSSQFYNGADRHEQVHYEQYDTGIASSYYTLNDLWQNHLQGLSDPNRGILGIRIQNGIRSFLDAEDERITPLIPRMEADAYRVSDQISPQYVYQNCGRYP